MLAGTAPDTDEGRWLANAWPPERPHVLGSHGAAKGGRWPRTEGRMTSAVAAAHPGVAVRGFSLGFGTHDGKAVFLAERRAPWAWARPATGHPARIAAPILPDCMVPPDPLWQRRLRDGARVAIADGWRAPAGKGGPR